MAVLDAGLAPVWNLSVGETHEYVANGLLVFNSIRNGAMRFGVALDLWAKEDLHLPEPDPLRDLKAKVWAEAKKKKLTAEELAEDFTAWSSGGTLQAADPTALADYWLHLQRDLPSPA